MRCIAALSKVMILLRMRVTTGAETGVWDRSRVSTLRPPLEALSALDPDEQTPTRALQALRGLQGPASDTSH